VPLGANENDVLSRSVAKDRGVYGGNAPSVAPAPPPPATSSIGHDNASPMDDLAAESQVLQRNNADERRRVLKQSIGRSSSVRATPSPSTVAPPSQSLAVTTPRAPQPDEEAALVNRLKQRHEGDCTGVNNDYRQLEEHFREAVTPEMRLKHAHCQHLTGHLNEALSELRALRQEAPALAKKIDVELTEIKASIDQESQARSLETAAPAAPKPGKKAKRAPAKATDTAPADAFQ
jgi:hypothetical protein